MTNFNEIFTNLYGAGYNITVTIDNKTIRGTMYGNDECFDCNDFFQILVSEDGARACKCFYAINSSDFGDIDYTAPRSTEDITNEYEN